jgi:hypothetical protein
MCIARWVSVSEIPVPAHEFSGPSPNNEIAGRVGYPYEKNNELPFSHSLLRPGALIIAFGEGR